MQPSQSILDKTFQYTPSHLTDIQATWRRFGWQPRSRKIAVERAVGPTAQILVLADQVNFREYSSPFCLL